MARIVIIDDDAFELAVHVEALKEAGHNVAFYEGIAVALEAVRAGNIDLAVVDIMMPTEDVFSAAATDNGRLTGVRLLEEINRLQPTVLLAILTVRKDRKLIDLVDALPIVGLIHKPCMPDDFVLQIDAFLLNKAEI